MIAYWVTFEIHTPTDLYPVWSCDGEWLRFDCFFFWIDKPTVAH
jgi:hypothetical protein